MSSSPQKNATSILFSFLHHEVSSTSYLRLSRGLYNGGKTPGMAKLYVFVMIFSRCAKRVFAQGDPRYNEEMLILFAMEQRSTLNKGIISCDCTRKTTS